MIARNKKMKVLILILQINILIEIRYLKTMDAILAIKDKKLEKIPI